jgi:prolyl oligopeptidase
MRLLRQLPLAVPVLLSAAVAAAAPAARVEPVTDDYYGTKVTDPYRWMENGKDPEWMPWLKGQAAHTSAVLNSIPARAAMLSEVSAKTGALPSVASAQTAGGVMVWQERPAGAQDFRLMIGGHRQTPRVLFDPSQGASEGVQVIDGFTLSPDGQHVIVELSKRGTERSVLHVLETATGKMRHERIADTAVVSWLPDSSGFGYVNFVGEFGTPSYYVNNQARLHLLSQAAGTADAAIPTRSLKRLRIAPGQWALVFFGRNSETAMLAVRDGRSEFRLYRSDLRAVKAGAPKWERVADFSDTIVDASWAADNLYVTTRKESSNGRVLRLSAAKPALDSAEPISIPGNPVIEQVTAAKSGAWVKTLEGGVSGLWFAANGARPRRVNLPYEGTVGWLENDPSQDDALISLTGWFAPAKVFHLAENGDVHDIGLIPPLPYDVSPYQAVRGTARAQDGKEIPYTLLAKKGFSANGANPLLLEAYGSYGASMSPRFQSRLFPFLDRGGIYVLANVRGGGEFGRDWHYAGKAGTKATTWRDAIAVAEHLVATKVTSQAKMTILGTSAGGVMVGGAINERPDLFTGAVANVGFMNPIRYVSEQNFADIEEWGGPISDANSFKAMYGLDPYVHIKDGAKYPATLVVSGINDPRAATFHSAKYAARLAKASASGEPVLLRIDFDAGHGMGSSRSQADATWTDIYSFVLWQAGVPEFQPAR